jgi:superfamily II DNA or RNA helicase
MLFDPRVGLWRAPACQYRKVRAELRRAEALQDTIIRRLRSRIVVREPELRPYQRDAVVAWETAGRRGIVVLPTGSGKTRVAIAAMARLGAATLVLAPTRALLAQWRAGLAEHYAYPVGMVGDGLRDLRRVTVCTFESAYRHLDGFGDRFALLVVDEVHHFGRGLRDEALEMAVAPCRLGLTATPPDDPAAVLRLEELVGPVVCRLDIPDLAGTHLAPYRRVRLPIQLEAAERARYEAGYQPFLMACRALARSVPGGSWAELCQVLGHSANGRHILAARNDAVLVVGRAKAKLTAVREILAQHRAERTIVFTADNEAAYALSRELLIPAITCEISTGERQSVLAAMQTGEVRALVSSRVLNEGVDLPEASVAVVAGGRLGTREHLQRVGRVLRPRQGKTATIYDVFAADTYEERHAERRHLPLGTP